MRYVIAPNGDTFDEITDLTVGEYKGSGKPIVVDVYYDWCPGSEGDRWTPSEPQGFEYACIYWKGHEIIHPETSFELVANTGPEPGEKAAHIRNIFFDDLGLWEKLSQLEEEITHI